MVLLYLANSLNEESFKKLRRMFLKIDTNKNGTICSKEFKTFFDDDANDTDLKDHLERLHAGYLFDMIDQNNNGLIEYMEFIAATIRKQIFDNFPNEEDVMKSLSTSTKDTE